MGAEDKGAQGRLQDRLLRVRREEIRAAARLPEKEPKDPKRELDTAEQRMKDYKARAKKEG